RRLHKPRMPATRHMTIPTYDRFIDPILRFLASHPEGVTAAAAHDAASMALGLTGGQKSERLPRGVQAVYKNRAGWAHDRLKRAGYSSSPKRGVWQLTEAGRKYGAENPKLSEEQIQLLALINSKSSPGYNKSASGSELEPRIA